MVNGTVFINFSHFLFHHGKEKLHTPHRNKSSLFLHQNKHLPTKRLR